MKEEKNNVKNIIKEYLIKNNYDGLCFSGECGCRLDDLMPCETDCTACESGVFGDCRLCSFKDEDDKCEEEWDWCITDKK